MSFICGNAYILNCEFTRPLPKKKYAICINQEKQLFFFINTNPRRRYDQFTQLEVTPSELPFLKYNSFINIAEHFVCEIPLCDKIKDFGSIPDHIKQKIQKVIPDVMTLPQSLIDNILSC
jgi:hypothetical protein